MAAAINLWYDYFYPAKKINFQQYPSVQEKYISGYVAMMSEDE